MAGLLGVDASDVAADAVSLALAFAKHNDLIVVLKGADTVIANADGVAWLHTGGSVGLGTSGSGDVLAGIICGLMAQGVPSDQAAVWGVTLHGRAGKLLSREVGTTGFLAREIAPRVPAIKDELSGAGRDA
jgi:NAD(P)H-hydrate repair Nnr-like enzyme with NAD(P)H-hydrate dehydratase domain